MSDDLTCPKCGKRLSWLSGSPARINNLYCEHCDYRAWDREAQPLANNSISKAEHERALTEMYQSAERTAKLLHKAQLAELERKISNVLLLNTVGSCSCLTKSPDITFHDEGCKYRIITELSESIEQTFKDLL